MEDKYLGEVGQEDEQSWQERLGVLGGGDGGVRKVESSRNWRVSDRQGRRTNEGWRLENFYRQ